MAVTLALGGLFAAEVDFAIPPKAYEMGEASREGQFWKSDAVLFVKKHQEQGFKFSSEDRRAADSRRDGGVTCFGMPVYETRVMFADKGGIARVELMLFNRGGTESVEEFKSDDGHRVRRLSRSDKKMSREEFFKVLRVISAKLTPQGGKAPQPKDERTREASVHQRTMAWPKSDIATVATLSWNYTQHGKRKETFRPGFIRLAVDGPSATAPDVEAEKTSKKTAKSVKTIAENVIRDSRGDVFVDNVPMVDQGMKGYCAVSSAERVMRYYGLDVDEHEIAEAAGTSATLGTSIRAMKDAVDRIGKRYRLATVLLFGDFDDDVDARIANLNKEVANYNKAAKKLKKAAITDNMYITCSGNCISYNVQAVDEAMDAEVLKEMKTNGAQKSKYTKFKKDIHQNVDKGMPLYWSVKLGIYPETDLPQSIGGHMRLVIGYNDKKDEILYTDSWGKGHELKRMPMGWAWTISKCLMVMKPLK